MSRNEQCEKKLEGGIACLIQEWKPPWCNVKAHIRTLYLYGKIYVEYTFILGFNRSKVYAKLFSHKLNFNCGYVNGVCWTIYNTIYKWLCANNFNSSVNKCYDILWMITKDAVSRTPLLPSCKMQGFRLQSYPSTKWDRCRYLNLTLITPSAQAIIPCCIFVKKSALHPRHSRQRSLLCVKITITV